MNIAVLLRAVPDPVEELELKEDETDLDRDYLGYVLNEFDDHALEEALLLKEDTGGTVTAYALGTADEVEQILYTAVAKGADSAVKIGDDLAALHAHDQAELFAGALGEHDLILTGVQASDEIDGQVGMLLSARLGYPHVSVVVATAANGATLAVTKEYWAGITAGYEVTLPAVLGIQAARQAPRYVAVSRIRDAQQSGAVTETDAGTPSGSSRITVIAMRIPESGEGAEMIEGDEAAAAGKIVELLTAAGVGGGS